MVDDDPTVLAIVEAVLGPAGASVTGTSAAGEFWEALEHDPPDLVLLDLDLPGTNGAELCHRLRGDPRWVRLPVVFLSAHTGPAAVEAIFSAGADDLLAKPIHADELVNRVTSRLRRMRALAGPGGGTVSGPASTADVVVVVEDDDVVAELLEHALGGAGYRTCRLQDGSAAAEALASGALRGTPLVLLDISLPGLDGFGVLEHLGRAGALATTRVLVLTARSSETEVLRALELGAVDHVAKPFSVPVLMERVRHALAR